MVVIHLGTEKASQHQVKTCGELTTLVLATKVV